MRNRKSPKPTFKKYFVQCCALVLAGLGTLWGCEEKKTGPAQKVVIGVQPTDGELDLEPFRAEVQKRLGMPVEIAKTKDYADLVERFKTGSVDFGIFTGLTFVQAEREAGAKALLKKVYGNNEFYYSAIVVMADSKIKSVADLKGKRFGFVDPKSTSGYLYPRVMLRKANLDAGKGLAPGAQVLTSEFFGTHPASIQALIDGKTDAIGVWAYEPGSNKGAWTEPPFDKRPAKFRVIEISDPIPNDAFAVREKFYSENPMIVFKLMEALIGMGDDAAQILKKTFNVDRMATATSRHYDSIRALESLVKEEAK